MRLPREAWTVRLARTLVRAILADLRITAEAREAVEIAVSEACANAVQHADPATDYLLRMRADRHLCTVEVIDAGAGFDIDAVPTPPPLTAGRGRGLWLIQNLVDELDARRRHPAGTLLRFTKRLT